MGKFPFWLYLDYEALEGLVNEKKRQGEHKKKTKLNKLNDYFLSFSPCMNP